jgi:hypothetical protein
MQSLATQLLLDREWEEAGQLMRYLGLGSVSLVALMS